MIGTIAPAVLQSDASCLPGELDSLDGSLVTQCLYGDRLAFDRILEKYHARIQKYCCRVLGSPDKAQEATQEVFARAFEKLHTLREGHKLGAWLKSIAVNYCLNLAHHERPYVDQSDVGESVPSTELTPEQHLIACERQRFFDKLIERLPVPQGVAFRLMYVDGYTYQEIAQLTGLSGKQVKSHLQNARRNIRQAVAKAPQSNFCGICRSFRSSEMSGKSRSYSSAGAPVRTLFLRRQP